MEKKTKMTKGKYGQDAKSRTETKRHKKIIKKRTLKNKSRK